MNNKEIYEELLPVFLESQGILKEFKDNLNCSKGYCFEIYIQRRIEDQKDPRSVIDNAFTWSNTSQGSTFWNRIHNFWEDIIWINRNPVEAYSRADYEPHRTER